MRKPVRSNRKKAKAEPNAYKVNAVAAVIGAIVTVMFGAGLKYWSDHSSPTYDDPHSYSFTMQGLSVSGSSRNPFEKGKRYLARVEVCEEYGFQSVFVQASCYLTIKPTESLTISNSENLTSAIYEDGSVAKICCMFLDTNHPAPLYRIKMPPGMVFRRTFPAGSEIQVLLNIPDEDPGRQLDAISFSPGEGVPAVLFPIRGSLRNRVFSQAYVDAHKDDPRFRSMIAESYRMRDQFRSQAKVNRGLTYAP